MPESPRPLMRELPLDKLGDVLPRWRAAQRIASRHP
jgi:hypothetical protein